MAVPIDIILTEEQKVAMAAIPAMSWFTQFVFRNAVSPVHPSRSLVAVSNKKQEMLDDWIRNSVRGKHVLDMFSANGGFSLIAALAGAREVVGVEFSEERIRCAEFVASTVQRELDCRITFRHADVYNIASIFHEPFDVVLCFGGLYHIADPPYVLKQVARLTRERLLLQTSQVLPIPGSWARFNVRRLDKTAEGMTSLRAGYGTWECSPGCLREVLLHAGFKVVAERVPSILLRRRFPWYMANCEPQ